MGDRASGSQPIFANHLCLLRGAGDLATGVAWRLTRAGFPVVACELARPLTVRRSVSMSSAVLEDSIDVEGMVGRLAASASEAVEIAHQGDVGVVVAPTMPDLGKSIVVDARLAKANIDTTMADAPLVIALGPGFTAGLDCHAVIETARGHHLGRVLWEGPASPDTGTPGLIGGKAAQRVLRAPVDGRVDWGHRIGDVVPENALLGRVADRDLRAPFAGVIRGLIADGSQVTERQKIGDIDPRADPSVCSEISDKSLAVGGGVLEAVLTWLNRTS